MALQKLHRTSTRPEDTISDVLTDIDRYRARRAHTPEAERVLDAGFVVEKLNLPTEDHKTNLTINSDLIFAGN